MSRFNISECVIPTVWCGNGQPPKRKFENKMYYYKIGNRYECLKKGFGAGMYTEKRRNLPGSSLQQIKYVGEIYEKKFRASGINTLSTLRKRMLQKTTSEMKSFLKKIFTRKGGTLDKRAYNSTIMYMYRNGNRSVPKCSRIRT